MIDKDNSIYSIIMDTPELCKEEGERILRDPNSTQEQLAFGLELLERAVELGDWEAKYIIGRLLLDGILYGKNGIDSVEAGLINIYAAANRGCLSARVFLNTYCRHRYQAKFEAQSFQNTSEPLKDFNGERIKLKRSGLLTPIDAQLEYINGENVLTLSANVNFLTDVIYPWTFYNSVIEGFKEWEGEYEVFGGQKLRVAVELTMNERAFDTVIVIPMTQQANDLAIAITNKIGTKKRKEKVDNILKPKRSFAATGVRKWSVRSRKFIILQSESGNFDEYEELKHVSKHEFGHALGLGDLYKSETDGFPGVDKGSYQETDSYYITDNIYNLVMCDHHGPISNNDIEMVILAFSRNRFQHYQKIKSRDKISEALGKGN